VDAVRVLRFVKNRERMWMLALLVVAVPLTRLLEERLTRVRAGGLTQVAQRRPLGVVELTEAAGGAWRLEEHRGQVVVINLWATWCGPCIEEEPELAKFAAAMPGGEVAMVGVSLDSGGATEANQTKVEEFARHFQVRYPLAFPAGGMPLELQVPTIPVTILVDRQGRVAKTYRGEVTRDVLAEDVRELLRGG
jgi:cytochrome c biogenesis protein CcmG/thiol:disulfide interchange protein DsbE